MIPRILIAVETCHQYRARANAQRETWAHDIQGADLRFFIGGGEPEHSDEIVLPVNDGYLGLPAKTKEICKWALEHGYTNIFKTDDDSYVQVDRLLASGCERFDYAGRLRGPSGVHRAPYCSGFGYWLSAKSMQIIADAPLKGPAGEDADDAEDRFVGNTLLKAGIWGQPDYRYVVVNSGRNALSGKEAPRKGNDVIAACEFTPEQMEQVHREWLTRPSQLTFRRASGPLSRVAILVKTCCRDGYLFRCIKGIERTLPEAKIVIVDDGFEDRNKITLYARLRGLGHACIWLPFDSGFGAKANAGIPFVQDKQYVLIASDDFEFNDISARDGIMKLMAVLDHDASIDIASGRVNGNPYEALLEIDGSTVREIPGCRETRMTPDGVEYRCTDLTVNYSLARTSCFGPEHDKLHWDGGSVRIGGGEHGAYYIDAKRLGYGVAVVPDVSIREMPYDFSQMHPMYPQMRNRAQAPGRACLRARGIEKWVLQDGVEEVC